MRKVAAFLWLGILCSVSLTAQLSGNYTIGGTSGSRNFNNWSDFVDQWNKSGLSAAVRVDILSSDTLSNHLVLQQHPTNPTTKSKPLIINGNGHSLRANLPREVIHLNGIDFVYLKRLTIENHSNNPKVLGLRLSGGADSNVIDSCRIVFAKLKSVKGATDTNAYLLFAKDSGTIMANNVRHNGIGNRIVHNTFTCKDPNSSGPYFGILDQQGSSDYLTKSTHNQIDSNYFGSFFSVGIYLRYVNGERVGSNIITRENCTSSSDCDTTVIGVICLDARSDSQALQIEGNQIASIPFLGANLSSAANLVLNFYGVNLWKVIGGKHTVQVENNRLKDLIYTNLFYGVLSQYSEQVSISHNQMEKIAGEKGYAYGIYTQYGDDVYINGNRLRNLDLGSTSTGGAALIFGYEMGTGTWGKNTINDNTIDSNLANTELYAIAAMNKGNWEIARNNISHNKTNSASGITSGIFFYFVGNMDVVDNLVAQNYGPKETYYLYATNYNNSQYLHVYQNTFYDSFGSSTNHASALVYLDDDSRTEVVGNIVHAEGSGEVFPMFLNTINALGDITYNSIYLKGFTTETWAFESGQYTNFKDWNAYGAKDTLTYWIPANFANTSQRDFRSREYRNQNNVPKHAYSTQDILGKPRHLAFFDRGAVIDSFNVELLPLQIASDTVCAGLELTKEISIVNHYEDTVTRLHWIIDVNGKRDQESWSGILLANDTLRLPLKNAVRIDALSKNQVRLYLSSANDHAPDDTFTADLMVKPAPGGSKLISLIDTSLINNPIYGALTDTVLCNYLIQYEVSAPRFKSNADYGVSKSWFAETQAYTSGGRTIPGASILVPSVTNDLVWKFQTNDTGLEDSNILVKLRIVDNQNNCDTTYIRQVYIEPRPVIHIYLDTIICLSDTMKVKNQTELTKGNGYLSYLWDFGNGDTTNAFAPEFRFSDTGLKQVRFEVRVAPTGYRFEKIFRVRVLPIPEISFTKGIACEGKSVTFNNTSNRKNVRFDWDFGDASLPISDTNEFVIHPFDKRGFYQVSLSAESQGCRNTITQRVQVFEQPIAKMTVVNEACQRQSIAFSNATIMNSAIFGVRWYFDDSGAFNTQKNTTHTYQTSGTKHINYVVKSEFGCIDSVQQSILIKESPVAQMTATEWCQDSLSKFENATQKIAGSLWQLRWLINDSLVGSTEQIKFNWLDTGLQKVVLQVVLDNGCVDSVKTVKRVKMTPSITFDFNLACAGDTIQILNTSISQISQKFKWIWESQQSESKDLFLVFDATDSMAIPVTLYSFGDDICTTSLTQWVSVLPRPKTCDFEITADYAYAFYGLKLEPKNDLGVPGGQNGVSYTWEIENREKIFTNGINGAHQVDLFADGTYRVSMQAKTDVHGCTCGMEKIAVMDRLLNQDIDLKAATIYPNPGIGNQLYIQGTDVERVRVIASDARQWEIPVEKITNTLSKLEIPEISAGVYQIEIIQKHQKSRQKWVFLGQN